MNPKVSRGELADRGFRYGVCTGAVFAFTVLSAYSVMMILANWRGFEALKQNGSGGSTFLALWGYLFSFPAGIALIIAGTAVFSLLCGVCGIIVARLFFLVRR